MFAALPVEELAAQAGFTQRTPRKLSARLFLEATVLLVTQSAVSLRRWAVLAGVLGQLTLSKQSLWERLNERAVAFLRLALAHVLSRQARSPVSAAPARAGFRRILVQDSTTVKLCPALAAAFPGSANQCGSKHGQLRIQAVCDLVGQQFLHFGLSSFRRNDQAAAGDVLGLLQKGDLVLRDLGYFVLQSLAQIAAAGAYYVSRLRADCRLEDASGRPLDLLQRLQRGGTVDLKVRVGEAGLVARLVALPLDPAVAAERRRRARQNRDGRCRPSARALKLLGWAIYLTNVEAPVLPAKAVAEIYGWRWRVEIIFKSWKSHFRLEAVPAGSAHALEALVYARLIFLTAFAQTCARGWLNASPGLPSCPRSLLKVASLLADFFLVLFLEAQGRSIGLAWLLQLDRHASYDTRTRQNFIQKLAGLS